MINNYILVGIYRTNIDKTTNLKLKKNSIMLITVVQSIKICKSRIMKLKHDDGRWDFFTIVPTNCCNFFCKLYIQYWLWKNCLDDLFFIRNYAKFLNSFFNVNCWEGRFSKNYFFVFFLNFNLEAILCPFLAVTFFFQNNKHF